MLSRSYLTVTFGFGLRSLLLSILVVLLARALGPSDFGGYAAAASLASFFAMFSGFGAGPLHVRDVAHARRPYAESLNRTLIWIAASLPILAAASFACAWFVIPHNVEPLSITLIVLGELMFYATIDIAMRIMQALERYGSMVFAVCFLPALRVVIATMMVLTGTLGLMSWAWVSFSTGALACIAVFGAWAWRLRGNLRTRLPLFQDGLSGLGFAVATASSRVHGDADKVVLARLASTATAGVYTLAYRLVDVFLLPVSAGVERLLPALFRQGQHGLRYAVRASAGKIALTLMATFALCAGVYLAASLLPLILGDSYREAVPIAHALSAVPLTMTCWIVVRTLAATSGYERATGAVELAGALFNVGATITLVLTWGWQGAVAATYLTHIAMVASFISYLAWRAKFVRPASAKAC